jgi:hypothetical protein
MSKQDEEIDAMHMVAETNVPPYREVLRWMRRLAAVANAASDRDAEKAWNCLIGETTDSREAMDGVFRAAQLLRDSEVITDLEAAWVFGQLYEQHEWPFSDSLGLRARTELEAGFYEARGEVKLAKEFRDNREECWSRWEEGRFTLVEDMRGVDARLGAAPNPAHVDAISGAFQGCFNADGKCWDERALRHLAYRIPHGQVTGAVRAAQECRGRGELTKSAAAHFLIPLLAPVVQGMCQFDRAWRQVSAEMYECLKALESEESGAKTRRLWERHGKLAQCRARRESQMWAYCFRVFGEHELARVMREEPVEKALAA